MPKTVLERFEAAADSEFASQPLPHPNAHVAAWYLLTVSEDAQRILLVNPYNSLDERRIEYFLDRYKFSLRQCLMAVRAKAHDRTAIPLPANVVPALYERTHSLLAAGIDYSVVAQICSSAHTGSSRVVDKADGYAVELDEQLLDKRYGVLELMRQSASEPVIPYSAVLWFWIQNSEEVPIAVHQLAQRTRISRRRIQYAFEPQLSYQLAQSLTQLPFLVPDGWRFPWGGRQETTLLLNALSLRIVYHLSAVHFGAIKYGLKGGAESDLCLCIEREQLVHDIALNSSLELSRIRSFVDYLTYGRGVDSPDQALQPIVPLGAKRLAIAGIGFLSSNAERNLLTLQARLEPNLFDSQSSVFEVEMTRSLQSALAQRWERVAANRRFQLGETNEELDLLVCEPESRTVLVLELRWMLSPADPREVHTKRRTCYQKVDQVKRKVAAASANLPRLLRVAFDIALEPSDEWNVCGAVVVQGFGGALSQQEQIPVIPDWVFEAGVRKAPTLKCLAEWMKSLDWLPVEGRDFEVREKAELLSIKIRHGGIVPKRAGREYLEDATCTLSDILAQDVRLPLNEQRN